MKNIFKNLTIISFFIGFFINNVYSLNIVFDPGHGGNNPGCCHEYDGQIVKEKDLNYKIALFIKDDLSKYKTENGEKVKIYLTRNEFDNPTLAERIDLGIKFNADIVISLHNNASPSNDHDYRGSMVLVTSSNFNDKYEIEENLAKNILKELNKIGLQIQTEDTILGQAQNINGLLRRLSTDESTYLNGDTTDWYGIIRHGIMKNIPSILVEHAYLSNEQDYREFLSTDDKLKSLSKAVVEGIVQYYSLIG